MRSAGTGLGSWSKYAATGAMGDTVDAASACILLITFRFVGRLKANLFH